MLKTIRYFLGALAGSVVLPFISVGHLLRHTWMRMRQALRWTRADVRRDWQTVIDAWIDALTLIR